MKSETNLVQIAECIFEGTQMVGSFKSCSKIGSSTGVLSLPRSARKLHGLFFLKEIFDPNFAVDDVR